MLIINADDWGRSRAETEYALTCHALGTVTSVSAMVFMKDSERAAELANKENVDVGLHVNFTDAFTAPAPQRLCECQGRIARFLKRSKYALLFYHPLLRSAFRYVYEAQADEFQRIYGRPPTRIDGHQHMHLCSNMLFGRIIPCGQRVRRTFSFRHGEKGALNLAYRAFVQRWMAGQYATTEFFFALSQCLQGDRLNQVMLLAKSANVELMTHPAQPDEYALLTSESFRAQLGLPTPDSSAQMQSRPSARL